MHDTERLFREYHATLVRYLPRRLGDRDWAEDVAQETFVRALRQESIVNERSWLFAVANNLVRDDARRTSRQRKQLELMAAEVREQERESPEEAREITLKMAQDSADARRALEALVERDRQALLMKDEGLDYNEIADVLGIEKSSAGTTLSLRAGGWRRLTRRCRTNGAGGSSMPHPDEGLIHAWLDGELDAAEAARVEALVATDPAWAAAAAEAHGLIAATARIVGTLDRVPANVIPAASVRPKTSRARGSGARRPPWCWWPGRRSCCRQKPALPKRPAPAWKRAPATELSPPRAAAVAATPAPGAACAGAGEAARHIARGYKKEYYIKERTRRRKASRSAARQGWRGRHR